MLDWTNPDQMVSQYFSVREALWLHQWNRLANESDGLTDDIKNNLITLCNKLDTIREYLEYPMIVHCMYRSPQYNLLIGAPENDVHSMGMACDYHVDGLTIEETKAKLVSELDSFDIRMEYGTTTWIHNDVHEVIHNRYFNP